MLDFKMSTDIDPGIFTAIQRGILAGIGILTFFIFFPGEPFDFQQEVKDELRHENDQKSDKMTAKYKEEHEESSRRSTTSRGQIQAEQVPAPPSLSTNRDSEASFRKDEGNTDWIWILNWAVYMIAIAAMMRILKITYGIDVRSHFILYFKYYFPREAAVLHL
jgi:hypothetical protein